MTFENNLALAQKVLEQIKKVVTHRKPFTNRITPYMCHPDKHG